MSSINTETETVIKKILPYMKRRGYVIEQDFDFETAVSTTDRYTKGYVDILVTLGKKTPLFLIEAKRIGKNLTNKDRDQAISYARSKEIKVPFVVVTNGKDIQCFNTKNKQRIIWDGKRSDKVPSRSQVEKVVKTLRTKPDEIVINISNDESLPFRQGLPLRQLNALFAKGHNTIRKIEKDEDYAFADFSKFLFLKLLEEKNDLDATFSLPYSYRFYELAETPIRNADQVKNAIKSMIEQIVNGTSYGDVLREPLRLENPKTFLGLVKDLASVSFCDCSVDSKGAAFEYYVRATLKGKKLGQYFTPRELVQVMSCLVGEDKIINSVIMRSKLKVLDPACGTGGFLVYLMQDALNKLQIKLKSRNITKESYDQCVKIIKEDIFYGSDANRGVAASAKMNMIIAGDGHTHIIHEDSLSVNAVNWEVKKPDCNLIMTNPPFGTTEGDSLVKSDKEQFNVNTTKGQYLFLQKMIDCTVPGGEICTVIDEGVLNTSKGAELRKYILTHCIVKAVINLPAETFKPNKINVKSSVLYLEKREVADFDLENNYKITFCEIDSLGYMGSGDKIRDFNNSIFLEEIRKNVLDHELGEERCGYHWKAYDIWSSIIYRDNGVRLDYKYWDPNFRKQLKALEDNECISIKNLNTIDTSRGISPSSDCYVDEKDGFALVVKAGSISRFGEIMITSDSDWIEKSLYDEYVQRAEDNNENRNIIKEDDVLLASTGDGTLGKCCVYDKKIPAIADGHVTIIRVDKNIIDPYYLADYLRCGFGAKQIACLYSGSTGLIELTPEQVDMIIIDNAGSKKDINVQKRISKDIREREREYIFQVEKAKELLDSVDELWM
ncbi:MAG: N-6 DNA methylase [Lachnospiraceae bacterium]|nr:N-6 DNA methylase [Lachnospiraceae bacterium]